MANLFFGQMSQSDEEFNKLNESLKGSISPALLNLNLIEINNPCDAYLVNLKACTESDPLSSKSSFKLKR
tara:strand:+ start:280 stop:489 length:210 start_codon:yes stop_codon:yes gene_type:complete